MMPITADESSGRRIGPPLSEKVSSVLKTFGWAPERWIDPTPVINEIRNYKLPLIDGFQQIIGNMLGIVVDLQTQEQLPVGVELIKFDPRICFCDAIAFSAKKLKQAVVPIAEVDNISFLLLAADGTFWWDHRELFYLGASFDSALAYLLFGKPRETWE